MPSFPEVRVVENPAKLFDGAATEFSELASEAVKNHGRFSVALSGGSTPRGVFSLLASGAIPGIPWQKIFFFWGDERHVPPDHPDSNYRMARETLLSRVPVPAENIFRIPAEEKEAAVAAEIYEKALRSFFPLQPGELPRFDLIYLGIGTDGHTASLFPGTYALQEKAKLVTANWVEKLNTQRITLTLPVLNNAAQVTFLVSGTDKAPVLREILENPAADLPSQKVQPVKGRLEWLVDRAAAADLSPGTLSQAKAS
jgi:6-phosphogluconolactonase